MYPKRIPKHLIFDPQPKRKSKTWLAWLVVVVIAMALAVLSLAVNAQETALPEAGQLSLTSVDGEALQSVHLTTEVSASITGLVVTASYVQRFKNTSSQWAQGIYVFPLPDMAAIQQMEMIIGDRRIQGEIKERKLAEQQYQRARTEGKRAALTVQQRDNLFTQKVANIAPHQTVEVRLTFIDTVRYQEGVFEWRLPTTLTPRYIPGSGVTRLRDDHQLQNEETISTDTFGWAMATKEVPDAPLITPGMVYPPRRGGLHNPLSLDVQLQSGVELASIEGLNHQLQVNKQQDTYHLRFTEGQVEMDRDVVLQWQPVLAARPRAAVFQQQAGEETFAMIMMLPPNASFKQALPKDIIFVIDVSGSMQGQSIVQAKASLDMAVEQLSPEDRFNIIAFSNDFTLFNSGLTLADSNSKQIARHWVSSLVADGGTQMYPALQEAYNQMPRAARLQQIVFITDGAIGNEEMLFELIANPGHNARLFTVGIGSAPNTFFMNRAAKLGRGSVELIGSASEVQSRMTRLFTKLNHVAATNINIDWPLDADTYPQEPGDLFQSEALLAFARLNQPLQSLRVRGDTADTPWQTRLQASPPSSPTALSDHPPRSSIGALWARHKVADIEDQGRLGNLDSDSVRQAVLDVALKHSLLTRYTAFIAIEEAPARPLQVPLSTQAIDNVMSHGSGQQPVMFANTATSATLTFWLGLLGCVAAFLWGLCLRYAKAGTC